MLTPWRATKKTCASWSCDTAAATVTMEDLEDISLTVLRELDEQEGDDVA